MVYTYVKLITFKMTVFLPHYMQYASSKQTNKQKLMLYQKVKTLLREREREGEADEL